MKEKFPSKQFEIIYQKKTVQGVPDVFIQEVKEPELRNNKNIKSINKRIHILKEHNAIERGELPRPLKQTNYSR